MILGFLIFGKSEAERRRHAAIEDRLKGLSRLVIIISCIYSAYVFSGITRFTQLLEIVITVSFLIAAYRLARGHRDGYLLLALMNSSNAILMGVQDLFFLMTQQLLSVIFVLMAYWANLKRID
jgi:nicotinamide riboside transporter PnuC